MFERSELGEQKKGEVLCVRSLGKVLILRLFYYTVRMYKYASNKTHF